MIYNLNMETREKQNHVTQNVGIIFDENYTDGDISAVTQSQISRLILEWA